MVQKELDKSKSKSSSKVEENKKEIDDNNAAAYQELYELTQRKFLRQLYQSSNSINKYYPILFGIDRIANGKFESLEQIGNKDWKMCLKPLCEYEEGWHTCDLLVLLPDEDTIKSKYGLYFTRVMNIIKQGNLSNEFDILTLEKNPQLLIDSWSINQTATKSATIPIDQLFIESILSLQMFYINQVLKSNLYFFDKASRLYKKFKLIDDIFQDRLGVIKRCELKNGKITWLCNDHIEKLNARIIDNQSNFSQDDNINDLVIEEIEKIEKDGLKLETLI